MINHVSSRPARITPLLAARARNTATQRTPLFSVDTSLMSTAAASPKRSPAEVPAPSAALPSQSQVISSTADLRQIFNGVPASTAPAINTTPPAAVTPQAATTPQAAPFVPTFRTATGSGIGNDGNPVSWSLNRTYFASKESAQWIANKYGAGQVIEVPFGGAGGPFSASANEYHIKLADGRTVNAGILAGYYERNPEDKFPGLAEKLIRNQLGV